MSRPWKARTAVYIVRVGEGFKPTSVSQWPESFTEARMRARNVSLTDARATVRAYNKAAMEKRAANVPGWDRQWMIAGCCVRAKGWNRDRRTIVESDSGSEYKPPVYTPEFLVFWEAYPSIRKTGKLAAWLAWRAAGTRALPVVILAAAKAFAVSPLGRSRFCPGPTQWLNHNRWEDDRTAWQRPGDEPMRDRRAGSHPDNQVKPPRGYTSKELDLAEFKAELDALVAQLKKKIVQHSGSEGDLLYRVVLSDGKPFYVKADRIRLEDGCVVLLSKAGGIIAAYPLSQLVAVTLHPQAKGGVA